MVAPAAAAGAGGVKGGGDVDDAGCGSPLFESKGIEASAMGWCAPRAGEEGGKENSVPGGRDGPILPPA